MTLSAVVSDAPPGLEPSYVWELDLGGGDWDVFGSRATFSYMAAQPEVWAFRVTVAYPSGESATSAPLTVEWTAEPENRAPVVDEGAAAHGAFVGPDRAPRGVAAFKDFEGIFSDPDGDALAYAVSVPADRAALVESVRVDEDTERVWLQLDGSGDWRAVTPALDDPLVTAVTLTAMDPGGLSASVTGYFRTDWDSGPRLRGTRSEKPAADRHGAGAAQPRSGQGAAGGGGAASGLGGVGQGADGAEGSGLGDLLESMLGAVVVLTFDQDLQAQPGPGPGQFTVTATSPDGSTRTIVVSDVTISGRLVILELARAPRPGETLTLDYTHRDATPLKRAAPGGDALASFTGEPVTADNDVSVGFLSATYSAAEGSTVSVTVNLSAALEGTVVIPITATGQGGASSGDYSGVPNSVTFNRGRDHEELHVQRSGRRGRRRHRDRRVGAVGARSAACRGRGRLHRHGQSVDRVLSSHPGSRVQWPQRLCGVQYCGSRLLVRWWHRGWRLAPLSTG